MPLYKYKANDSKGIRKAGTVDAHSQEAAVTLLKQQGLYIVTIEEKRASFLDDFMNIRGVSMAELVGFTRQFSTMISAGLPLTKSLDVLTTQAQSSLLKKILYDVLRSVEGGLPLSEALGRYPDVFTPTYQALVSAGESSGNLDIILKRLAEKLEAERELSSKLKGAMIYPSIIFTAMIGVFFLLMIFVIPKLAVMYESLDVELPAITKFMLGLSTFMVNYVVFIILSIVGLVLGFRTFRKSDYGYSVVSELSFKIPVFGRINKMKDLDQFMSTLALLLSSAVPIVESLNIVSEVVQNRAFKEAAATAAKEVEKGNELAEYFSSNPVFPPLVAQMAGVGQETGKMDEVLEKVSEYLRGEIDHLVKGVSAALEPIILVILGTMIGFLIISVITPIYKITSSI